MSNADAGRQVNRAGGTLAGEPDEKLVWDEAVRATDAGHGARGGDG